MSARLKGVMGLVVIMWLLVDVHHVSAITAMDGVILSQRNYSSISCVIANLLFMNFTLPTMVQIDDVTRTPAKQLLVVQDPYVFTQEHVDFMERNVATAAMFIVVRASRVRECNAIHAVCCTYYWVTDAYPPGLSLSEVDPSLIMWNGTGTSMPLDLNYTKRFAAVDCSATNDSAVPPDLRRPPSQYPIPALVRIGARTPLVWDFYGRMRFIVASTYIEVPLHLNLENAETAAYIKGRMGELTAPIGDPWAILGTDAMNFELAPGDSLVNVTRSGALGHIPVMVPIVVSVVFLALILLLTLTLCASHCRRLRADPSTKDVSPPSVNAAPVVKPRADSFRRCAQGLAGEEATGVPKRISLDSAMSSSPSQLQRVSSSSSMGSQRSAGGGRTPAPRRPSNGSQAGVIQRQDSFSHSAVPQPGFYRNPMLPRTSSQGSMGSRNGSFRLHMTALPPPPAPPTMMGPHYDPQQQQQQMMMMAAQGRQSPFIAPQQPSPVMMFPQQPQQPLFFPSTPGFTSSWQPSPSAVSPLTAEPMRRPSQASLRSGRHSGSLTPAQPPQSPSGSILQKTSSFKRQPSSSSIGGNGGAKNGSKRGSAVDVPEDKFANPLASRRPTFL